MRRLGFDAKPFLEGMSRGGLIIHNWAAANPDKVSGLYGDNPVLDIRSWPGGFGKGKGSPVDWRRCMKVYGLKSVDEVAKRKLNPLDHLEPLAKAGVPILYILGTADTVVPPSENAEIAIQKYRRLGGRVEVIRKPGMGHHPHSLPNPQPIVDFVLQATGRFINPATLPAPSAEYRAGAGWGRKTWWQAFQDLNTLVQAHPEIQLVFLGDSITQGWTGHRDRLAHPDGQRLFDRFFARWHAVSLGLSGDRTEHVLFRIQHGNLSGLHPQAVVLMIGVNNIHTAHHPAEWIAAGTEAIVKELCRRVPEAKIFLLGCFPTNPDPAFWERQQVNLLHQKIAHLDDGKHVIYVDLRGLFLLPDGRLDFQRMRSDGIHLKPAGYEAWARALVPILERWIGEGRKSRIGK